MKICKFILCINLIFLTSQVCIALQHNKHSYISFDDVNQIAYFEGERFSQNHDERKKYAGIVFKVNFKDGTLEKMPAKFGKEINHLEISKNFKYFALTSYLGDSNLATLSLYDIGSSKFTKIDHDVKIYVWNSRGSQIAYLKGITEFGKEMPFMPKGVYLYDLETGSKKSIFGTGMQISWAEHNDKIYVKAGLGQGDTVVHEIDPKKEVKEANTSVPYGGVDFSNDGNYYLSQKIVDDYRELCEIIVSESREIVMGSSCDAMMWLSNRYIVNAGKSGFTMLDIKEGKYFKNHVSTRNKNGVYLAINYMPLAFSRNGKMVFFQDDYVGVVDLITWKILYKTKNTIFGKYKPCGDLKPDRCIVDTTTVIK